MRSEADKTKLQAFMAALGRRVRGPGRIYLTGGATAVLRSGGRSRPPELIEGVRDSAGIELSETQNGWICRNVHEGWLRSSGGEWIASVVETLNRAMTPIRETRVRMSRRGREVLGPVLPVLAASSR